MFIIYVYFIKLYFAFSLTGRHPSRPSLKGRSAVRATFKPYGLAGSVCPLFGLSYFPLIYPLIYPSPKSKISTLPQGEGKHKGRVGCTPGVTSPRPLREREEFQVELWRNFEIRVRGLFFGGG